MKGKPAQDNQIKPGDCIGGHYIIKRMLGQGGMGCVYKAEHNLTGQPVAIKTLSPHLAEDPGLRERFIQEARTLASLDHDNVMTLHTFLEDRGQFLLVMQFIDGQDLDAMYRRCGGLHQRTAVPIFYWSLRGLEYAHQRGVIHRDLKPANILVTKDGRVKLTDFGIARMIGGLRLTMAGAQVGTVFYMAPEQLQGAVAEPRSDIYAMGVSLFEVLTGRLPYEGDDYTVRKGHVEAPIPDPRQFRSDITSDVAHIVMQALSKRIQDRFQTAEEFLTALESTGLAHRKLVLIACPSCQSLLPQGEGVTCPSCKRQGLCPYHIDPKQGICQDCVQGSIVLPRGHKLTPSAQQPAIHPNQIHGPAAVLSGHGGPSKATNHPRNPREPRRSHSHQDLIAFNGSNVQGNSRAAQNSQGPHPGRMRGPVRAERPRDPLELDLEASLQPSVPYPAGNGGQLRHPTAVPLSGNHMPGPPLTTPVPKGNYQPGRSYDLNGSSRNPRPTGGLFPSSHPPEERHRPAAGQPVGPGTFAPKRKQAPKPSYPPVMISYDGSEMVLIEAGTFIIGAIDHKPDTLPVRELFLDSYYIDRYPVTNELYLRFVQETNYPPPPHWWNPEEKGGHYFPADKSAYPVVNVQYDDAKMYCKWAGKRLPSEAEWEKAGRSTDGRLFPWGNAWKEGMANLGLAETTPVFQYPQSQSPYGVFDLLGNTWEWVADWYAEDSYQHYDSRNPKGPNGGKFRVVRGGSHADPPGSVSMSTRGFRPPHLPGTSLGFRCVYTPKE